ncbi:MAG: cupin domain-containing protein [Nitrospinota bacterium]
MAFFKKAQENLRFSPEKMQKSNPFETERLFCDVYCLEPGQSQKAHAHAGSDKIYCVLEGRARVRVSDEERTLGPGEIALAREGLEHGVRNDGPGRASLLVLMAPKP